MALYHKDVGFPANLKLPQQGEYVVDYGNHARQEAIIDRYGSIDLPKVIDTKKAEVIEVETRGNEVVKVLYRMALDARRDVCMPVIPQRGKFFAKTVWVNVRGDRHHTLDKSRYTKPG